MMSMSLLTNSLDTVTRTAFEQLLSALCSPETLWTQVSVVVGARFRRSRQRKRLRNKVGRLYTDDISADLGVVRRDRCIGRAVVEQHRRLGFTTPLVAHRRPQRERLLKRQGAITYRS